MADTQRDLAREMNRMAEQEQRRIFGLNPEPTEGAGVLDREKLGQMLSLPLGKPASAPVPEGKRFAPDPIAEIKMVGGWNDVKIGSGPDDMHPLPPGVLQSFTVQWAMHPEAMGFFGMPLEKGKPAPISISFPLTCDAEALKPHGIERVEIKTVSRTALLPRWYAVDPRHFIPRSRPRHHHQLEVKAARRKRRNRR